MLELKAPPCKRYSIAGKAFILGEYAVLAGLPAVVAAVGPRFELVPAPNPPTTVTGSPLDRLLQFESDAHPIPLRFRVLDPFQGAGGFGASTAEFALAYLAYTQNQNPSALRWKAVWSLYRELMAATEGKSPSGADLIAQWQGGVVFFDPSGPHCMDLWPLMDWSGLLVFSATAIPGRKVATHENLKNLSGITNAQLESALQPSLARGISAIQEGSPEKLGQSFTEYADALASLGLEAPAAYEDRKALSALPGVLGVKGSGALLSDTVLVLAAQGADRAEIFENARSRGLKLVAEGLTCEMGVLCQV